MDNLSHHRPDKKLKEKVLISYLIKDQFSSVAQSYLTLCYSMNHSTPGLPVHHQLPEFMYACTLYKTDKHQGYTYTIQHREI